jgi:hypothetical protein
MTTTTPVLSRELAEQALEAIRTQFATYIEVTGEQPRLFEPGSVDSDAWAIGFVGPFEWVHRAFTGGVDEELWWNAKGSGATDEQAAKVATTAAVPAPRGVHVEALDGWAIALYPA